MRVIICVTFVTLFAALSTAEDPVSSDKKPHYDLENAPALFEKFIKDYNKTYKDAADRQVHYEAFYKTLQEINKGNADPNDTAFYDINPYADYTEEQWKKMRGLLPGNLGDSKALLQQPKKSTN